jgi:small nuclear ribonucleoprotein (snRNP)-like protein
MCDLKLVDKISHSEIRNILLKHNIKWRKSKTVLSNKRSNDSEYTLKKRYVEHLRYNTSTSDSVLLYVDEKGPITAKTHGGTSWSSVQVKVEKAQKINGILNVFREHMSIQMTRCMYNATKRRQQNSLSIF